MLCKTSLQITGTEKWNKHWHCHNQGVITVSTLTRKKYIKSTELRRRCLCAWQCDTPSQKTSLHKGHNLTQEVPQGGHLEMAQWHILITSAYRRLRRKNCYRSEATVAPQRVSESPGIHNRPYLKKMGKKKTARPRIWCLIQDWSHSLWIMAAFSATKCQI